MIETQEKMLITIYHDHVNSWDEFWLQQAEDWPVSQIRGIHITREFVSSVSRFVSLFLSLLFSISERKKFLWLFMIYYLFERRRNPEIDFMIFPHFEEISINNIVL